MQEKQQYNRNESISDNYNLQQYEDDTIQENLSMLQTKSQQQRQSQDKQNQQQQKQQISYESERWIKRYRQQKYFKQLKHIYKLNKSIKIIVKNILEQQKRYINNLQSWEQIRTNILTYLKNNIFTILTEDQLENLFGSIDLKQSGNLNKIKQQSKKQLAILENLVENSQFQTLFIQLLSGNFIGLYQIYNDSFKQLNMILYIINVMEQKLLTSMLLTKKQLQDQQRQQYSRQHQKKQDAKTKSKQIYDDEKQETVVAISQIVDSVEIPTKHYSPKINNSISQEKPKKYQKLLQVITSIRNNIFIFLDKLSAFLQYLIKYGTILIELYEQHKYPSKPTKSASQEPQISVKQLLKQSKECLTRISCIWHKMLYPSSQSMDDNDIKMVNTLAQLNPQIFNEQSNQINNNNDFPYVISFTGFDTLCMGKSCLVYLIKDYIIAVEDNAQVKINKKKQTINRLVIIHLDHTTQVQIYQNKMACQPLMLYISGGQKSNSIFLEFKGKRLTPDQQKKFKQHCDLQCNQKKYVCSKQELEKWQRSTAVSNMKIIKSIIQLKISYFIFNYNCQAMRISTINDELNRNYEKEISSQMRIIKPTNSIQHLKIKGKQVVYPQQKQIPNCNKVHMEVLGMERRNITLKYYIIRLSILQYLNNSTSSFLKQSRSSQGQQYLHEQINYNKISQIVYLQESELLQLQKCLFQMYDKYHIQNINDKKRKQGTYFTIMRLSQFKQNYINNYLRLHQKNEIQCMIIMDFFNTFFKNVVFKKKSSIILNLFKISQGFWNLLQIREKQEYDKINYCYHYNRKNGCFQCILESQDALGTINDLQRYWKFYQLSLSYPQQQPSPTSTLLNESINRVMKKKKKPYCHLYAYNLQSNYINSLHKIYSSPYKNPQINGQQKKNSKQFCKELTNHFNKICYIKYYSQNTHKVSIGNGVQYNLLKSVVKIKKTKKIIVLVYNFPKITEEEIKNKSNRQKLDKLKTQHLIAINQEIGTDLLPDNQGFLLIIVGNIHKDTTIKHLKFLIGQQLGLCNQYIGHFMETFALTLVVKEERKDQNDWLFSSISSLFTGQSKRINTQYVVKQLYVIHDFQKVFDVLNNFATLDSKRNYLIGLKKLIKVEEIPLFIGNKPQNQQELKLINCYYQLLQLQLAEMWYKLNEGEILIMEKPHEFVKAYCSYLYAYFHIKLGSTIQKQKDTKIIWYKMLLEKGILSKRLLKQYYKLDNKQIKQQLVKQVQLLNEFKLKLQQSQNTYAIINKLIKHIYQKTSWHIYIQNIQLLKNPQKQQDFPYYYILINDTGILLMENLQKYYVSNVIQDFNMMPTLSSINRNASIILINYHDFTVEMFGSVICLSRNNKQQISKIGKICINSQRAYKIYQLIKFYKKWNQINDPSGEKQIKFNFSMLENSRMIVKKQNQKCKSMKYNISENQIQLLFSQYFNMGKSNIEEQNNYH